MFRFRDDTNDGQTASLWHGHRASLKRPKVPNSASRQSAGTDAAVLGCDNGSEGTILEHGNRAAVGIFGWPARPRYAPEATYAFAADAEHCG